MVRHRSVLVALLMVIAVLAPAAPPAQAAAPDFAALLRPRPYVPLLTTERDCDLAAAVNSLPGAQLGAKIPELRSWYAHFHADTANIFPYGWRCRGTSKSTLAKKLTAKGAWVSNYRNGSAVSQSSAEEPLNMREAADLEATAPLAIGTFWPGNALDGGDNASPVARLTQPLDASSTTVRLSSSADERPEGAPSTWPYVNSRGTGLQAGATSQNTHDFVSWVRVDNELMQVVAEPSISGSTISLKVRRGLFGTAPASHPASTQVMSPLYIGDDDGGVHNRLFGAPLRDDADYPLRYSLKVWRRDAHLWIVRRIRATFTASMQGYNTVWLDVSTCNLFNTAAAAGQTVEAWDDLTRSKLTDERWGQYQREKLATFRAELPGVRFAANSFVNPESPCQDNLLAEHYDAGALENWMKPGPGSAWTLAMAHSFRIQRNNWPGLYWIRWDRDGYTSDEFQRRRFTYGSYLLSRQPTATRARIGGPWGLVKPDELYFWNWGAPWTLPAGVDELRVSGIDGLYRRDFANGIVVVNGTGRERLAYRLDGTYYDVVNTEGGKPRPVTSVSIAPGDAAFLLRSA